MNKKYAEVKNEVEDEEEEMEVEIPPVEVVVKKKVGRKRKQPPPPADEEVEEVKPEVEEEPPAKKSSVLTDFLEDYGPQLKYSYELWTKNSKVLDRVELQGEFTENPLHWSVTKVGKFIKKLTNDAKIAEKFTEQDIDGEALACLCQDDLTNLLGLKMGVAIKIYNRILHLRQEVMLKFFKI